MTVSPDARTPSASVHALSGSTPPGAGATMQPFGVATAAVHELPDTFASLDAVASGVIDGLSARRAAAAHPDAAVIDFAGRTQALADRHARVYDRMLVIHGRVDRWSFANRPKRPDEVPSEMTLVRSRTDTHEVTHVEQPLAVLAEQKARREAWATAQAAHDDAVERKRARTREPYLDNLQGRMWRRLERWTQALTDVEPRTQAGLAAKIVASNAVTRAADDLDWAQKLVASLGWDALRIIGAEADARAEQDRQADGELFSLVARLGPARQLADDVGAVADAAYAVWRPVWEDKPAALWQHADDRQHGLPGPSVIEGDGRPWYDFDDVAKLRSLRPVDQRSERNEAGEARRLEIIAASEAWVTAYKSAAEASGYNAACDRTDQVVDAMLDLEDLIHKTPAHTLAGLIAKARVEVESAERREVDTVPLAFIREVARFAPSAPAQSNIRPAPLPSGVLTGRYPAGTSREDIETYRTFLDMELRYLNWEIYGQAEGRLHLWMDNPAADLHGPGQPAASSRAAAVLGLLGLTPTPGVDGRAQAEGLARTASAA